MKSDRRSAATSADAEVPVSKSAGTGKVTLVEQIGPATPASATPAQAAGASARKPGFRESVRSMFHLPRSSEPGGEQTFDRAASVAVGDTSVEAAAKRGEGTTEASLSVDHAGSGGSGAVVYGKDKKSLSASGTGPDTKASLSASHEHGTPEDGSSTSLAASAEHGDISASVEGTYSKNDKKLAASGAGPDGTSASFLVHHQRGTAEEGNTTELAASAGHGEVAASAEATYSKDHKKLSGSGSGPDGTAASLSFSHDHGAPGEGNTTELAAAAEHAGIGGGLGFKKSKDDTVVSASGKGAGVHAGLSVSRSRGFEEFFGGWASELASVGGKFTREGMELKGEYTVWNTPISIPIPAAPALNMVITPSVKVSGEGGGYWGGENKGNIDVTAAVTGGVMIGASVGVANFAEAYIQAGPTVTGAFRYTRTAHAEGDAAAAPAVAPVAPVAAPAVAPVAAKAAPASDATPVAAPAAPAAAAKVPWKLGGSIAVNATANVGVNVLGGLINPTYDLVNANLFTVSGLEFDQSGFHNNLQFVWGEQLQNAFRFLQGEWVSAEMLMTKTRTKLSHAKEKVRTSTSNGRRRLKVLFEGEREVITEAKKDAGNSAVSIDKRLDTMELTAPAA